MTEKGVIYLNTNDITSNPTKTTGIFTKIMNSGSRLVGVSAYKFNMNITNINDNNNIGVIVTGTMSYPVSIASISYDLSQLAIAVQTALNALSIGTFSVFYDNSINKYVITSSISFKIITNPINGGYRDFFDMMGFKKNTLFSLSYSSEYNVNINYTDCVYLVSNELNRSKNKKEYNSNRLINHLVCIYSADFGTSQRIENIRYINIEPLGSIDIIDISIYDDQGRLLINDLFDYQLELYMI